MFSVVLFIIISAYVYTRYNFLKAKNFKPDQSRAKNILDLRPAIIAKLQQVVKDGSDGLYVLSIQKLGIDVLAAKLDAANASITVDTVAMLQLDKLKKLPDDIFKIKFASLHIDGIGLEDLINKKHIAISAIYCNSPLIEVYHKNRTYNKAIRKASDTLSLYRRIKGQATSIVIGKINIGKGTFINHNLDKKPHLTQFNVLSIVMKDLLIDSTTQYDTNRFLFTKYTAIECNNYFFRTPDSLYFFKIGSIQVSGEQHKIIATDVELTPRGNKRQFESRLSVRKVMLHLTFPKIALSNINWWSMINRERFIAKEATINHGSFYVYLDRSLPFGPFKINNFPQQVLMNIPVPVSVRKLTLHHLDVSLEEFNPDSKESGTTFFDDINGTAENISNVRAEIKKARYLTVNAKSLFMHKIPMAAKFRFDLSRYRTGEFTADIFMDTLNNTIVNPIAKPLGLFNVRTGQMQTGFAHLEGNDFTIKGTVALNYTNLHIDPLKKNKNNGGKLKKKTFTGLFANIFLIKNSNPGKGNDLRKPTFSVSRGKHSNFISFIWFSILTGILKTIGIPVKLVLN
ncbi:hypothetical protein [Ginsengibacter hankyongi]|uniref:hypothetical protein n=1 Tax=Ginsengibacter hankyongi TaxID=2607284 RepID=UPI00123D7F3F|nr:hypothetical protein [Ginsengibacter hankyongi]